MDCKSTVPKNGRDKSIPLSGPLALLYNGDSSYVEEIRYLE